MSSKSLGTATFSGIRIGATQYVPASIRQDGKKIHQRLLISAYINTTADDSKGGLISHPIRLIAWQGAADVLAKYLTPGKEFHALCEVRSYEGRIYDNQRNPVNNPDGTPLMGRKTSYNVLQFSFGDDAEKFIANDPRRGPQWNVPGTPDNSVWLTAKAAMKAQTFVAGMENFGCAKVLPIPAGHTLFIENVAPNAAPAPITPAAVAKTFNAAGANGAVVVPEGFVMDSQGNMIKAQY